MLDHLAKKRIPTALGAWTAWPWPQSFHIPRDPDGSTIELFTQIDVNPRRSERLLGTSTLARGLAHVPENLGSRYRDRQPLGTDGSLGSGPLISRDFEEMMNLRTEAVDFPRDSARS